MCYQGSKYNHYSKWKITLEEKGEKNLENATKRPMKTINGSFF